MKNIFFLITALLILSSCTSKTVVNTDYSTNTFNTSYVKSNLEFLASDELEGREATSHAEKIASLFIVSELKKYGLMPFGDNGTYFQEISFSARKLNTESNVIFYNQNTSDTLWVGKEIVTQAYKSFDENFMNKRLPVVFGGFGITAEEFDYDDYTDVNPEGKIVIILSGEPYSENPDFFNGEENSKYNSPFDKVENARKRGASGVLIIPSDEYNNYWGILASRSTTESLGLSGDVGEVDIPVAMISQDAVSNLMSDQETTFESIKSALNEKDIPRAFELTKTASINFIIEDDTKTGKNVVALLPGNNPDLKNEYITIGAHYDHVGITDEKVYNGADDNGSGTTAVLEAARLLSERKANERPIVFILYTAEEKGLLGSQYFVENCGYTGDIITNINIDMTGRESIDTIHCIGSDRASGEFHEIIKLANAKTVNYFLDYSLSNTRLFRQSDHYSFASKDIPVVFLFDNMMIDLHKPEDDIDKINFNKICKTAHLAAGIGLEVANLDHKLAADK
jgi:hypothetical protein